MYSGIVSREGGRNTRVQASELGNVVVRAEHDQPTPPRAAGEGQLCPIVFGGRMACWPAGAGVFFLSRRRGAERGVVDPVHPGIRE